MYHMYIGIGKLRNTPTIEQNLIRSTKEKKKTPEKFYKCLLPKMHDIVQEGHIVAYYSFK